MWLYASPFTLWGAALITLGALLWTGTGRNPGEVLSAAVLTFRQERRFRWGMAGLLGLVGLNRLETWLDGLVAGWVPWDLTEWAVRAGGGLIPLLQQWEWPPITHLLTFVYVILFPLLVPGSFVLYASRRDWRAFRHLLVGNVALYLGALPFFILAPVREAWHATDRIVFLIPEIYPAFEEQFRPHSGLDNCFPSFHTGVAVLSLLIARHHGYRRLTSVLAVVAPLIMFSTLYLGVHWLPDMAAGALFALAASRLAANPSSPARKSAA